MELRSNYPGSDVYRWGHLRRLRKYRPDSVVNSVIYTASGPETWVLRCDCGHQWEMLAEDFPGKRKMRTCGRPECLYNQPKPKPEPREPGIVVSVHIGLTIHAQTRAYAKANRLSFSRAVTHLLHKGLVAALVDEP